MFEVKIIRETQFTSLSSFEEGIQTLLNKGFIIKEFNTVQGPYDYSVVLLIKENNKKAQL